MWRFVDVKAPGSGRIRWGSLSNLVLLFKMAARINIGSRSTFRPPAAQAGAFLLSYSIQVEICVAGNVDSIGNCLRQIDLFYVVPCVWDSEIQRTLSQVTSCEISYRQILPTLSGSDGQRLRKFRLFLKEPICCGVISKCRGRSIASHRTGLKFLIYLFFSRHELSDCARNLRTKSGTSHLHVWLFLPRCFISFQLGGDNSAKLSGEVSQPILNNGLLCATSGDKWVSRKVFVCWRKTRSGRESSGASSSPDIRLLQRNTDGEPGAFEPGKRNDLPPNTAPVFNQELFSCISWLIYSGHPGIFQDEQSSGVTSIIDVGMLCVWLVDESSQQFEFSREVSSSGAAIFVGINFCKENNPDWIFSPKKVCFRYFFEFLPEK